MNLSLGCVRLENGRCPFLDGLEELPVTDQAKVLAWAKRLAAHDELRRPPYAKHLDDGIFELRLSLRAGEHRSFFFYCRGGSFDLHARLFEKDGQDIARGNRPGQTNARIL